MAAPGKYLRSVIQSVLGSSSNGSNSSNGHEASSGSVEMPSRNGSGTLRSNGDGSNKKGTPASSDASPFLRARRGINEKLTALQSQKQQWMVIAMILGAISLVAILGLLYLASTSRVEPFYTIIDGESGEELRSSLASKKLAIPDAVVRKRIEYVIRGIRTVYAGDRATTNSYARAYRYIAENSGAEDFINTFLEENKAPTQLVDELQRTVSEIRITPITDSNTWNVAWTEVSLDKNRQRKTVTYQGTVSIIKRRPTNLSELKRNPVGVYLKGAMWQQVSGDIQLGYSQQQQQQQQPSAAPAGASPPPPSSAPTSAGNDTTTLNAPSPPQQ